MSIGFDIDQSIAILSRTPGVLRGLLTGLDDPWIRNNYGPDTFSPFDVLGHLIEGEKYDWIPRAKIILEHGEATAFTPFDRYSMYQWSGDKPTRELLDEFEQRRQENIVALQAMKLTESDLDRRGTHPELGPVTMRNLLATWVGHDLHHIAQICKSMAIQYREHLGPWRAYLGIVNQGKAES